MVRNWCHAFRALVPLVAVLGPGWSSCVAQDLSKTPLPGGLVPRGTTAAPAAVVCFLEGPAVDAAGNVFFSDIAGNRILKMDPKGAVTTFRADSGRTNGNCFDARGRDRGRQ
jgi:gluconolactonase